jgi:putative transposase
VIGLAQKRTIDDLSRHLGELIQTICPDECKNYFVNAGYASIKT